MWTVQKIEMLFFLICILKRIWYNKYRDITALCDVMNYIYVLPKTELDLTLAVFVPKYPQN